VAARRICELFAAVVRELRVRDPEVGRTGGALDEPRALEALEQTRHARRRQQEAARQVDALQPLVGCG
jgi:hypothetical protein